MAPAIQPTSVESFYLSHDAAGRPHAGTSSAKDRLMILRFDETAPHKDVLFEKVEAKDFVGGQGSFYPAVMRDQGGHPAWVAVKRIKLLRADEEPAGWGAGTEPRATRLSHTSRREIRRNTHGADIEAHFQRVYGHDAARVFALLTNVKRSHRYLVSPLHWGTLRDVSQAISLADKPAAVHGLVYQILNDLTEALVRLDSDRQMHGDIKPANVVLTSSSFGPWKRHEANLQAKRFCFIDFGSMSPFGRIGSFSRYYSPSDARRPGSTHDSRLDVFMLAITAMDFALNLLTDDSGEHTRTRDSAHPSWRYMLEEVGEATWARINHSSGDQTVTQTMSYTSTGSTEETKLSENVQLLQRALPEPLLALLFNMSLANVTLRPRPADVLKALRKMSPSPSVMAEAQTTLDSLGDFSNAIGLRVQQLFERLGRDESQLESPLFKLGQGPLVGANHSLNIGPISALFALTPQERARGLQQKLPVGAAPSLSATVIDPDAPSEHMARHLWRLNEEPKKAIGEAFAAAVRHRQYDRATLLLALGVPPRFENRRSTDQAIVEAYKADYHSLAVGILRRSAMTRPEVMIPLLKRGLATQNQDLIENLIQCGADLDGSGSRRGAELLYIAISQAEPEAIETLLGAGCPVVDLQAKKFRPNTAEQAALFDRLPLWLKRLPFAVAIAKKLPASLKALLEGRGTILANPKVRLRLEHDLSRLGLSHLLSHLSKRPAGMAQSLVHLEEEVDALIQAQAQRELAYRSGQKIWPWAERWAGLHLERLALMAPIAQGDELVALSQEARLQLGEAQATLFCGFFSSALKILKPSSLKEPAQLILAAFAALGTQDLQLFEATLDQLKRVSRHAVSLQQKCSMQWLVAVRAAWQARDGHDPEVTEMWRSQARNEALKIERHYPNQPFGPLPLRLRILMGDGPQRADQPGVRAEVFHAWHSLRDEQLVSKQGRWFAQPEKDGVLLPLGLFT